MCCGFHGVSDEMREKGGSCMKRVVVTSRKLCSGDFLEKIEGICDLSPDLIILREKDLSPKDYYFLLSQVEKITFRYGVPLSGHLFWEESFSLGLSRIHLPFTVFQDVSEEVCGKFSSVGVSVHSLEEAQAVEALGGAYVIYGHVFETACKFGLASRGLGALAEVCTGVSLPVYGIGGITPSNETMVLEAGASGVCGMSSYMEG